MAFSLIREMAGQYDKHLLADTFSAHAIEMDLLKQVAKDIAQLMETEPC